MHLTAPSEMAPIHFYDGLHCPAVLIALLQRFVVHRVLPTRTGVVKDVVHCRKMREERQRSEKDAADGPMDVTPFPSRCTPRGYLPYKRMYEHGLR